MSHCGVQARGGYSGYYSTRTANPSKSQWDKKVIVDRSNRQGNMWDSHVFVPINAFAVGDKLHVRVARLCVPTFTDMALPSERACGSVGIMVFGLVPLHKRSVIVSFHVLWESWFCLRNGLLMLNYVHGCFCFQNNWGPRICFSLVKRYGLQSYGRFARDLDGATQLHNNGDHGGPGVKSECLLQFARGWAI